MMRGSETEIARKQAMPSLFDRCRYKISLDLCLMALSLVLWCASHWVSLGFNASRSVAGYLFLIVKTANVGNHRAKEMKSFRKGELVAFWPPANRFYHRDWFVKFILGSPGDVVVRSGQDFFINGVFAVHAKERSLRGTPLVAASDGVIPPRHYFVGSSCADGFDSRYADIGLIEHERVFGRAYRIF